MTSRQLGSPSTINIDKISLFGKLANPDNGDNGVGFI